MSKILEERLSKRTKAELISLLIEKMAEHERKIDLSKNESEDKITALNKHIASLKDKIRTLEAIAIKTMTEEETIKIVLKERACGKSIGVIYDKLNNHLATDMPISRIEQILNNIDDLEPKLIKYYKECKQDYMENTSFDDEHIRITQIENLRYIQDEMSIVIREEHDPEMKMKYLKEHAVISEKISKLLKGLSGSSGMKVEINTIMEDYNKEDRDKILNFNDATIEVINKDQVN